MRVTFNGYFYKDEKENIEHAVEVFNYFFNIPTKFSFNLYSISQKAISNLNLQHFNKPGPTDVLSFPLFSGTNEIKKLNPNNEETLGDMFFCRPILKKNAAEFQKGLIEELQLVLIHGLLHLVGYSHLNETKLRKKENEILDKVWNGLSKD